MSLWTDLYWGRTRFDFVKHRRRWFSVSAAVLLLAAGAFVIRGGFDLSVDFKGGTLVSVDNPNGATVAEAREVVLELGVTGARVQEAGAGEEIRVQTTLLDAETEQQLVDALAQITGSDPANADRQSVGPTFGRQIADAAVRALIAFLVVAGLYMAWRLQWKMAVVATIALLHDLLATAGIYAIFGLVVSPATVIAILTVLGYSLYDTVVLFDKTLSVIKERGDRETITSLVNESLNGILMRSINTLLTTLIPVLSLLLVGSLILGATTLREFAVALLIGITLGVYSSMFVAGPLFAVWSEREGHWQRVRHRVERKSGEYVGEVRWQRTDPSIAGSSLDTGSGVAPRPPRKRRKKR